jgi:hypothetical protein
MRVFLIAHTCKNGKNSAQATVTAVSPGEALKAFRVQYPKRLVHTTGERGVG